MDLDSGIREIAHAILSFPTTAMLLVAFWLYVTRNRRTSKAGGNRDRPGRVLSKGGNGHPEEFSIRATTKPIQSETGDNYGLELPGWYSGSVSAANRAPETVDYFGTNSAMPKAWGI